MSDALTLKAISKEFMALCATDSLEVGENGFGIVRAFYSYFSGTPETEWHQLFTDDDQSIKDYIDAACVQPEESSGIIYQKIKSWDKRQIFSALAVKLFDSTKPQNSGPFTVLSDSRKVLGESILTEWSTWKSKTKKRFWEYRIMLTSEEMKFDGSLKFQFARKQSDGYDAFLTEISDTEDACKEESDTFEALKEAEKNKLNVTERLSTALAIARKEFAIRNKAVEMANQIMETRNKQAIEARYNTVLTNVMNAGVDAQELPELVEIIQPFLSDASFVEFKLKAGEILKKLGSSLPSTNADMFQSSASKDTVSNVLTINFDEEEEDVSMAPVSESSDDCGEEGYEEQVERSSIQSDDPMNENDSEQEVGGMALDDEEEEDEGLDSDN